MDETVVTSEAPHTPEAPPKKSRVGCVIAGIAGVGCLVVLLGIGAVVFFVMRGDRGGRDVPSPEASVAPTELPSDFGTPETGGETSPPLVATPIQPGTLEEMLESVANEPQMAGSRTDHTLRRDVLRQIITSLGSSGCRFTVHGARVAHGPDASGAWGEVWDVSICDQRRALKVELTPSSSGGTDFTVSE